MAFLFVDRITHIERGRIARGLFTVPPGVREWPLFLLTEAVGQLASWLAMAEVDFHYRPVAALAGEVVALGEAAADDVIHLEVHAEPMERKAVLYSGSAAAGGRSLVEMHRCVGPLLPMEDFDDPGAVRARFARLCGEGEASRFEPVVPPAFEVVARDERSVRVALNVPASADLFAEHFPRRPVYPATLFLDRQIHVARHLLGGSGWRVTRVSHVKVGAFVSPGDRLEVEARILAASEGATTIAVTGWRAGVRVSRARMEFAHSSV